MVQMIRIDVPPSEWISANDRDHWAERKRKKDSIRLLAMAAIRKAKLTPVDCCTITAQIGIPTAHRFDPDNAEPTVKAMVDALVHAGILADDDWRHVIRTSYQALDPALRDKTRKTVVLTIQGV